MASAHAGAPVAPASPGDVKNAFLDEVRKSKKFFYGTVVAQAQRIDVEGDRIVFTFAPQQGALRVQLDQARAWLDALATQLAGRRMTVVSAEGTAAARKPGAAARGAGEGSPVGAPPAGARRLGRPGDARCVRRRDQGCRRDVNGSWFWS